MSKNELGTASGLRPASADVYPANTRNSAFTISIPEASHPDGEIETTYHSQSGKRTLAIDTVGGFRFHPGRKERKIELTREENLSSVNDPHITLKPGDVF